MTLTALSGINQMNVFDAIANLARTLPSATVSDMVEKGKHFIGRRERLYEIVSYFALTEREVRA